MKATADEMALKNDWVRKNLLEGIPFSFLYRGQPMADLISDWGRSTVTTRLDDQRTEHVRIWADSGSGLEVRLRAVEYHDFPAVEWTVYLRHVGDMRLIGHEETAILSDIQAWDGWLRPVGKGPFTLFTIKGDFNTADSYEPMECPLDPRRGAFFSPVGGRGTNGNKGWPYFNLKSSDGGVIAAIGWPGQWAASFQHGQHGLRVRAGQERTFLCLKPGEEIRTPLMALLFWKGKDIALGQNLWRRWFMAHNIPKINGRPPAPMAQMQLCVDFNDGADVMLSEVERFETAGIELDLYWRDAGWYPCNGNWWDTGTWEVDRQRFPEGFKTISEWIHARGKKLIVWFEPERVGDKNSWLAKNHPEWLLAGKLLNLGNPEARQWVVDRVDTLMRENGIDYYRQDFNIDPLVPWRNNDAADRVGMTENLYVQGYLAFWDELLRRRPGLLIDSCASGGRRNDLETMRRSVPLLRSDFQPRHTWEAQHAQTHGLSSWIPFYGSGVYAAESYQVRSYYMPAFGLGGKQDLVKVKPFFDEWRKIAPLMLCDYYPLTPYSLKLDEWIAWQFDRPEGGGGIVQVFRRDQCAEAAIRLKLKGLDPAARYEIVDFDRSDTKRETTGAELMEQGIQVNIAEQPGSAILSYGKQGVVSPVS